MRLTLLAAFALILLGSSANSQDRRVVIWNDTDQAVLQVYASPAGGGTWVRVTPRIVAARGREIANFDIGTQACRLNLKVVFKDETVTANDIDVCKAVRWELSDEGNTFAYGSKAEHASSRPENTPGLKQCLLAQGKRLLNSSRKPESISLAVFQSLEPCERDYGSATGEKGHAIVQEVRSELAKDFTDIPMDVDEGW